MKGKDSGVTVIIIVWYYQEQFGVRQFISEIVKCLAFYWTKSILVVHKWINHTTISEEWKVFVNERFELLNDP